MGTTTTMDLGLLAVFDSEPISRQDYSADRDGTLAAQARDSVQRLITEIFNQPKRVYEDSVIADLPPVASALPREKPLPKQAPMTKWEAFAKAKGIAPKPKKERLVFDDQTQEWVPRWGYKGKNKQLEDQWIVEVPKSKDADYDPVAEARAERKQRKLRNEAQRLKNVQRSAPKPSSAPAPSSDPRTGRKAELDRELRATRASTASMGKFDKVLDGDTSKRGFKRKFDANEQSAQAERSKSLAILSKLGQGSGPRQHVSDDSPAKRRRDDTVNTRRAIRHLTSGAGATSMSKGGKGGKRKR